MLLSKFPAFSGRHTLCSMLSLIYSRAPPPMPLLSSLYIVYPFNAKIPSLVFSSPQDSVMLIICGFLSSTSSLNSFILFLKLCAFIVIHLRNRLLLLLACLCWVPLLCSLPPPIESNTLPPPPSLFILLLSKLPFLWLCCSRFPARF